ncbi:MAG: hypothetical protein IT239_02795 [Bacteroidia bacterium]|nr:hypothetical protein [Bacteroidia bacterium]
MIREKAKAEHSEEKINQLVYKLHELTPGEINIIEEATKKLHALAWGQTNKI